MSDEGLRRLAEAARGSGLRIDEAARRTVEEGRSADFYRGYVSGIQGAVTLCRYFLKGLGEAVEARSADEHGVETATAERLIGEVVELLMMRMAAPAAVAAELYLKAYDRDPPRNVRTKT